MSSTSSLNGARSSCQLHSSATSAEPRAAVTCCSFKAAARLAHAKTSYSGGEQTSATQRKLCFNVIRDWSTSVQRCNDAVFPCLADNGLMAFIKRALIQLYTIREPLLLRFQLWRSPFISSEMDCSCFLWSSRWMCFCFPLALMGPAERLCRIRKA